MVTNVGNPKLNRSKEGNNMTTRTCSQSQNKSRPQTHPQKSQPTNSTQCLDRHPCGGKATATTSRPTYPTNKSPLRPERSPGLATPGPLRHCGPGSAEAGCK